MIFRLLISGACFMGIASDAFPQIKGDYIWQLSNASLLHQSPFAQSIEVRFVHDTIVTDTFYRPVRMGYFNASFSNDMGELLLYSNGCDIRNGNHQMIPGTSSLSPGLTNYEWCQIENAGYPIFEGGMFLPFYHDSIVLLLHQQDYIECPPVHLYVDTLYYTSVIRQGANYVLHEKSVPVVNGYLTDGNVEATKAVTQNAWWVIQGER